MWDDCWWTNWWRRALRLRALTNNPAKAALPAGVEVAQGYLGRPASLPDALKGIDTVYLAPLPALVDEFVRLRFGGRRTAGGHAVGGACGVRGAGRSGGWHYYKLERAIEEAGFEWTHLRPGQFMNNTLDWAESIKTDGVVRAPYPGPCRRRSIWATSRRWPVSCCWMSASQGRS